MTSSGGQLEFFVLCMVWAMAPIIVVLWGFSAVTFDFPPFALMHMLVLDMVVVQVFFVVGMVVANIAEITKKKSVKSTTFT